MSVKGNCLSVCLLWGIVLKGNWRYCLFVKKNCLSVCLCEEELLEKRRCKGELLVSGYFLFVCLGEEWELFLFVKGNVCKGQLFD